MKWNWQHKDWPDFIYDPIKFGSYEKQFMHKAGIMYGSMKHVSENDKETLNRIANWVVKRDGEILEQEYIKVLGANAYHMTFKVGADEREERGEQVHFTKDGKHYTMSILVPAQDYDKEIGQFRNLVKDFSIKDKS